MPCIQLQQVCLALPGRLVPLSLAGLLPGWCAPPPLQVLSEIDLALAEGDRLAVVGPPGAGKTALLRLLTGRWTATAGRCHVAGPVLDLVDPEERLDPASTADQHLDRLSNPLAARVAANCAGLDELLDVPLRAASPGMRWRLAFALASVGPGDIVAADRPLDRCDLAFRDRAERRLAQLLDRARAAILVEPDLSFLQRWCNRALWLQAGTVRRLGPARDVLREFQAAEPRRRGSRTA